MNSLGARVARIGLRLTVRFPGGPEGFVLPQFGPAEA
jgi:hypothetical protein